MSMILHMVGAGLVGIVIGLYLAGWVIGSDWQGFKRRIDSR